MTRVYIAAPWGRAREAVAAGEALRAVGLVTTSRWIAFALASKGVDAPDAEAARVGIDMNDQDLSTSDAVLALSFAGEGGEMFAEVRFALVLNLPVVWVRGRQTLSAWRPGVVLVDDLAEGVTALLAVNPPKMKAVWE